MTKHKQILKKSTKLKHASKKVKKSSYKKVASKRNKSTKLRKMPASKRYRLLMNCVAPHLLPQKEITYPLNSITRGDYLTLPEKLVYAEIYSMFKMSPKFQFYSTELSRVISIHKNVANIISHTISKLNKLNLVTINTVYDTKAKRKTPIGLVLCNNGALNQSVSYDLINEEAKNNHKQKSINHLQGGLVTRKAQGIIKYLNKIANRSFRVNNKGYIKTISAKLKQKYTVADCKLVIIFKYEDWKNDPKMKSFIQPSTLFRPSNFDRYLTNAKVWKQDNPRLFDENGNYIINDNSRDFNENSENTGGGFKYDDDF